MAIVETEKRGEVFILRLNRPERLNALNAGLWSAMADAFLAFQECRETEVAILTGAGRAFCAGEDLKEAHELGKPGGRGPRADDPFFWRRLEKPVIGALNGHAMGGGFMLAERTDLRLAVPGALFEVSEAKRWLVGGFEHGHIANLPHAIATEMALGFRFPSERLYELGFINRIVAPEALMGAAMAMAQQLLDLPPASRVNTMHMMRELRPALTADQKTLGAELKNHGAKSDLVEIRAAFVEKRRPNFKGWDRPEDRYELPVLKKTTV
ncbi:enoyl-CoA hydratase/isomerase family protein [Maritimibacter alkaliphilus]|uniref:enoyl-CoA hydratase/isomerase family protein n=1 Tax=Maritimibacter alkaliphilus TaxID=404236 RepID=UPI001C947198|nr:enoyl-CoA hydratase/isomerase family protein [Maritimibacter alkaliphilus]MBY6088936.1 enoyl-CoA hydratase/isomerase family protein [Maritimibacter alkaliphilus]